MSVLDDVRVTGRPDGSFTVARSTGLTVRVLQMGSFRWCVCFGDSLHFMPLDGGGFATHYLTAEAAIEAALA